jgi:general stress protein 26
MANNTAGNVDRAWMLMDKIGFAMPVTRDGAKLPARPMAAFVERDDNAIYMLTDARHHKHKEVAAAVTGSRPDVGTNRKVAI